MTMQQVSNSPLGSFAKQTGRPDATAGSRISYANLTSWPTSPTTPTPTFVSPATPQYKRERDHGQDHHQHNHQQQQQHPGTPVVVPPCAQQPILTTTPSSQQQDDVCVNSSGKRSRLNTYQAPREVPSSLISAMGSLVGGHVEQTNTSVGLRRNLSGGFLEQFFGQNDDMEEDPSPCQSRVRSMSL